MTLLRWLLFPITILYTLVVFLRNKLYDLHVFSSKTFPVRSIVIGNLAVGGAGKSPITQKCIDYFNQKYSIATLSRGYGRKTTGFLLVQTDSPVDQVGDEPLQFKKNFPHVTVAVDQDRANGIEILRKNHDLILLDDAFQHRQVTPTCAVLLFEYHSILNPMLLLPTGNFRDTFNQTRRADVILITKCPDQLTPENKTKIESKIRRYNTSAPLYYSKIQYLTPVCLNESLKQGWNYGQATHVLLVTGIANSKPLFDHLIEKQLAVEHISFSDHYIFKDKDYQEIVSRFHNIQSPDKIILTTEKDAQRLLVDKLKGLPVYYMPIAMEISNTDQFFTSIQTRIA